MRRTLPLSLVALIATAALAHEGVKDAQVKAWMDHMSRMADHTKTLGLMMKGERAFDADTARTALAALSDRAEDIPDLFEDPASDPKSEALPEIWDEWPRFQDLSLSLADAATVEIETDADLRPVMAEIGAACRDCHETFRK